MLNKLTNSFWQPISTATVLISASALAHANEPIKSTPEDQTALAVTIYNNNLALVKDQRNLQLPKGKQVLEFAGVSGAMQPETALLRNIKRPSNLSVSEQNFDYDLLSPNKLLEKSLGQYIQIARTNPATGKERIDTAKVLSTNNGLIVQVGNTIETNPEGRFIFSQLPKNLRAKPTLTTQLENNDSKKSEYELSYLTTGLSWKADYVAELTEQNTLDLASWVTLNNNSNTEYRNAAVQLVAGDVNRVAPERQRHNFDQMMTMRKSTVAESASVENLMEYKLYSLPQKTTLGNAQTKQVALFSKNNISVKRDLVFHMQAASNYNRGRDVNKSKAEIELTFKNSKSDNLGIPLPKGIVRVYQKDSKGNAQFIGEDRIDHIAENERVKLKLGKSFDVSAEYTQTDYKKISPNTHQTSHKIIFNNAKDTSQEVKLIETLNGDWEITKSTEKWKKISSQSAQWSITIPAKSKKELSFSMMTTY